MFRFFHSHLQETRVSGRGMRKKTIRPTCSRPAESKLDEPPSRIGSDLTPRLVPAPERTPSIRLSQKPQAPILPFLLAFHSYCRGNQPKILPITVQSGQSACPCSSTWSRQTHLGIVPGQRLPILPSWPLADFLLGPRGQTLPVRCVLYSM